MWTWLDRHAYWVAALAALMIIADPSAFAQERTADSSATFSWDHASLEQFAMGLVRAKTPAGILLLSKDARTVRGRLPEGRSVPTEEVESVLGQLQSLHSEYRLERGTTGGVVIIPRDGSWCVPVLNSRAATVALSGSAFEVLYQLYRLWSNDRSPYVPPGMAGRADLRPDLYHTPVSVNLGDTSLLNALNEVVRQSGLGWSMREVTVGQPGSQQASKTQPSMSGCNLALFDGQTWLETSWTLFVAPR